jgi:hypothetical protein
MQVEFKRFGEIEINGRHYDHDMVIEAGSVHKRKKKPSKAYRGSFGHTPLSADEHLPWGGQQLIIGTGMSGALPVMDNVIREAKQRGVELRIEKTAAACEYISTLPDEEVFAVLHLTC